MSERIIPPPPTPTPGQVPMSDYVRARAMSDRDDDKSLSTFKGKLILAVLVVMLFTGVVGVILIHDYDIRDLQRRVGQLEESVRR